MAMRDKNTLFDLGNIATFFRYLYSDSEARITFHNGLGKMQLRMDEELNVWCKNLNFPDLPEMQYSQELTPYNIMAIVDILKEQPPEIYPNAFDNRWQEIKSLAFPYLELNFFNHKEVRQS